MKLKRTNHSSIDKFDASIVKGIYVNTDDIGFKEILLSDGFSIFTIQLSALEDIENSFEVEETELLDSKDSVSESLFLKTISIITGNEQNKSF